MAEFDIVLCGGCEYRVEGLLVSRGERRYHIFSIPPNQQDLLDIVKTKAGGHVPKIIRARISYDVEWVDPPSFNIFDWIYRIGVVTKNGDEVVVASEDLFPPTYKRSGDIDITDRLGGVPSALGLNTTYIEFEKPGFYPVVVFRYTLRVYGTTGV
jgi:hypothetical protein